MRDEYDEEAPTFDDTVTSDERRPETHDVDEAGVLVAPGGEQEPDTDASAIAEEVDSGQAQSAEEAAMHITEEP